MEEFKQEIAHKNKTEEQMHLTLVTQEELVDKLSMVMTFCVVVLSGIL